MNNYPESISDEPPQATECRTSQLAQLRHVALDMDGTIYCGDELLKESRPFLAQMENLGVAYTFLTNNSSKSSGEYVRYLASLGIVVGREAFFTSAHATIELLLAEFSGISRLYVAGAPGLRSELEEAGFDVLPALSDGQPDAVIVGFDPGLDFRVFCKATYWIAKGVPYLATHPDMTCPTNRPTIILDCGALCAAIFATVGRQPDAVAGKPDPSMLRSLCQRFNLLPHEVAMVGDRLHTDVLMANRAGSIGVLTLTGETKRDHLERSAIRPDLVIENLAELAELITTAKTQ